MRSFTSSSIFLGLILAIQAHGHALIAPALGGGTTRNDVKRPNNINPCGRGVDPASLIDSSQALTVNNGQVDTTITNFNLGLDGSRFVKAQVDPTGTGQNFQAATVTTNGQKLPLEFGSEPLSIQMPAGMQASGGAAGNRMLIQFRSLSGFGNCIAVTMGADATNTTTGTANTGTTGTGQTAQTGQQGTQNQQNQQVKQAAGGNQATQRKQRNRQFQKMKIRSAVEAIAEAN